MVQMNKAAVLNHPLPRTIAANRLIHRSAELAHGVHRKPLDHMRGIIVLRKLLSVWRAPGSPDPIEYALVVGFLTLSAVAALPGVAMIVSTMFSSITSVLTPAVAGS